MCDVAHARRLPSAEVLRPAVSTVCAFSSDAVRLAHRVLERR